MRGRPHELRDSITNSMMESGLHCRFGDFSERAAGRYDVAGMGHNSPQLLHTMIETMRLAFADAQRYIADSDWEREQALPTEALLSKDCKWPLFASGRCLSPQSTTNRVAES